MATITLGQDDEGRNLILHTWEDWEELLANFPHVEAPYVCVFACDAIDVPAQVIGRVMEELLNRGCHYILCWGPDCERVHDIFEEMHVWMHIDDIDSVPLRMSTWHSKEPLYDPLWFALQCAIESKCEDDDSDYTGLLGLCQRREHWVETFTRAFSAPGAFNDEVMAMRHEGEDDRANRIFVITSPTRRTFLDFRKR
jgi:hypothetical protein